MGSGCLVFTCLTFFQFRGKVHRVDDERQQQSDDCVGEKKNIFQHPNERVANFTVQ
jgi:hypothetical protein